MKEVLTKSFWQGVKKTFHEALEGPPPENKEAQSLAVDNPEASPAAKVPPAKREEI